MTEWENKEQDSASKVVVRLTASAALASCDQSPVTKKYPRVTHGLQRLHIKWPVLVSGFSSTLIRRIQEY
jgi:hypothetical protein